MSTSSKTKLDVHTAETCQKVPSSKSSTMFCPSTNVESRRYTVSDLRLDGRSVLLHQEHTGTHRTYSTSSFVSHRHVAILSTSSPFGCAATMSTETSRSLGVRLKDEWVTPGHQPYHLCRFVTASASSLPTAITGGSGTRDSESRELILDKMTVVWV